MNEKEQPQLFRSRYKIIKKLGAGNFGTAYLVSDLREKNELKVLKVVRLGEMESDATVDSVREATLLSHLHNEYIVKFYESFLENDSLCIVTEYCEGGDLDQLFKELKKQNSSLEENQVVEWLIQILIAVQYMHKSRILHRDLKARNIFLKSNKVKIGDFGISRILVGTMDVASTFTGTPYYMSPEVMKHDGYESKSDIWSVGCLLYEMCTYQHAFDGKGLMNVIYKVVEGTPPELPNTYSKSLNQLLSRMFIKDPKLRPSAAELLQTSFIQQHRQRIKMTAPLENTISAHDRLQNLQSELKNQMSYGELVNQSWSLTSEKHRIPQSNETENDDLDYDDDEDVRIAMNTVYRRSQSAQQDFNQVQSDQTFKTARETMKERKISQADARGHALNEAIRSNKLENAVNRQMMRESTIVGSMKQPWPSSRPIEQKVDRSPPKYSQTLNSRVTHSRRYEDDATFCVSNEHQPSQSIRLKSNRNHDDRPITPMRTTYGQIADKFSNDDGLPTDPNLTNQYYEPFNDFEQDDDQSPTRDIRDREFNEQICRSFNATEFSNRDERPLSSSSQRSTINSLSRTIDPRYGSNAIRQSRYVASMNTIAGSRKTKVLSKSKLDEGSTSFKDNPSHDAFGPLAKNKKISSLRTKAIEALGQVTFDKVHDYLIKQRTAQRTDSTLNDGRITDGLRAFVSKPSDCFLVDQLVFLELVSNEK